MALGGKKEAVSSNRSDCFAGVSSTSLIKMIGTRDHEGGGWVGWPEGEEEAMVRAAVGPIDILSVLEFRENQRLLGSSSDPSLILLE
jgi:hypothetical protein